MLIEIFVLQMQAKFSIFVIMLLKDSGYFELKTRETHAF